MATRGQILLGFAAIYLLWGSTFLAIKIGDAAMPPLVLAASRFLIAGVMVYAWERLRGTPAPRVREWWAAIQTALLMFLVGYGVLFWAETRVASGVAAVLVAMVPLWVGLFERAGRIFLIACGLGAAGVGLLLWSSRGGTHNDLWAELALLGGAAAWAWGTIWLKRLPLPPSALMSAAAQMLSGGALLALAAAAAGQWSRLRPAAFTWVPLSALAYLVIAGSVIGYSAYVWLLDHVAAVKVATYALANPVVALVLGYAFAGERISVPALAGTAIILLALTLVLSRGSQLHAHSGRERPRGAEVGLRR